MTPTSLTEWLGPYGLACGAAIFFLLSLAAIVIAVRLAAAPRSVSDLDALLDWLTQAGIHYEEGVTSDGSEVALPLAREGEIVFVFSPSDGRFIGYTVDRPN